MQRQDLVTRSYCPSDHELISIGAGTGGASSKSSLNSCGQTGDRRQDSQVWVNSLAAAVLAADLSTVLVFASRPGGNPCFTGSGLVPLF